MRTRAQTHTNTTFQVLEGAIKGKVLTSGQSWPQQVVLRANAHDGINLLHGIQDRKAFEHRVAASGRVKPVLVCG